MADIAETRLALLYVEQLSDNMLLVDFRFFGSRSDAPEWNQTEVKNEDLTAFTDFLVDLYSIFKFRLCLRTVLIFLFNLRSRLVQQIIEF